MLFDMVNDPGETTDIAAERPCVVNELRTAYQKWFKDVSSTRGYAPPPIALGSAFENPVTLTRQDWRGARASWNNSGLGHWVVDIQRPGTYSVRFRFPTAETEGSAELRLSGVGSVRPVRVGQAVVEFEPLKLDEGKGKLEAILHFGAKTVGPNYVDVRALKKITEDQDK
jgi:hypothetical protein